jgi:hypothetical protein
VATARSFKTLYLLLEEGVLLESDDLGLLFFLVDLLENLHPLHEVPDLLSCLCRVGLSSDQEALLEGGGLVLALVLCLETFDLLLEGVGLGLNLPLLLEGDDLDLLIFLLYFLLEVLHPLPKISLKHHAPSPLFLEGANLLMKAHNPLLDWKPGLLLLIMLLQICE